MSRKIENLVVDTSAFINNVQLQEIADNLFTLHEVVEEVRCKRQYRNLIVLPYDLQVKDVDADCVNFVQLFAKKTGDYRFLSATDIKLIALTYQLEKEIVGTDHLRTEPIIACKSVEPLSHKGTLNCPGFYMPDSLVKEGLAKDEESNGEKMNNEEQGNENDVDSHLQKVPYIEDFDETVLKPFSQLTCDGSQPECDQAYADCDDKVYGDPNDVEEEAENEEEEDEYEGEDCEGLDPCITDDDIKGWITPSISRSRGVIESDLAAENSATVACYTTDFSMQNVLKQIGLNVVAKDGLIIRNINMFVLRCYACFQIVPQTTRLFCPKCGNKTLKRVTVYVDTEGKQHIKINFRRQLTARGKKFPLPRPKGGKTRCKSDIV
uniref:RNA-binding protein NOB1 n=1 Tax=Rhodnius prolixus TaxID=13249 RepID=R4FKW1_RHOPR